MHIVLLINMFFKYNEIFFNKKNCNITVIIILIELL